MRGALFLGNQRAVVQDFPDPEPRPGQVVVQMRVAAVCGSDLHRYRQTPDELRADGLWGVIPGHEPSGDVVALGPGVERLRVGDRVAVYHYLGCGRCKYCLSGYLSQCPERRGYGWHVHGSDADLVLTNEVNCLPLPPELGYVDGAFIACQASTTFSAMRKLNPSGRDTIAVFGLGPVGLCGVAIARALGARVVGVDVVEERLELGLRLGASEVVHGGKEDVVSRLRALTDGEGPALAYETSGVGAAQQQVLDALRVGGKGAFVGLGARGAGPNLFQATVKELSLLGSYVSPIDVYWELADFLVRHRIALAEMVTHRYPLADAPEAFRQAATARVGKVVFEWD